MEEKRYGIFSSLMDTIKAFVSRGRKNDDREEEDTVLTDKFRKLRDRDEKWAKEFYESLKNGGGTSGKMSPVLEMGENEVSKAEEEEKKKAVEAAKEVVDENGDKNRGYDRDDRY